MHNTRAARTSHFITLVVALLLCTHSFAQPADLYITDCNTYTINQYFKQVSYVESKIDFIYVDQALVYCSPDEASTVLDTLPFNSKVFTSSVIERFEDDTIYAYTAAGVRSVHTTFLNTAGEWCAIEHAGRNAYVKKNDAAVWATSHFIAGHMRMEGFDTIELSSIDSTNNHQRTNRFLFNYRSHGYELQVVHSSGLKECEALIHYRTYRESCPGGELHQFVAFTKGVFKELASCSSEGEGGQYIVETIYLPMHLPNDELLLVAFANVDNISNEQFIELNTFPYPENVGIPIDQLIVKTNEFTVPLLDEEGNEQYDEHEEIKVRVDHDPPVYYRWNGEEVKRK